MKIKLSKTEMKLALIVVFTVIFYLYWIFFLDPILLNSGRLKVEIASLKTQVSLVENSIDKDKQLTFELPGKEGQLAKLIGFIESKMSQDNMKMISLKQSATDGIIFIEVEFEASYMNVRNFIEQLSTFPSIISLTNVGLANRDNNIYAIVKIAAPYKL